MPRVHLFSRCHELRASAENERHLWWRNFQRSGHVGLLQDRHFLSEMEKEEEEKRNGRKLDWNALDARNVPVARLRAHFASSEDGGGGGFEEVNCRLTNKSRSEEAAIVSGLNAELPLWACSFEKTVGEMMRASSSPSAWSRYVDAAKFLRRGDRFFEGVPLPAAVETELRRDPKWTPSGAWLADRKLFLWYACAWRLCASRRLDDLAHYGTDSESVGYWNCLFRDCHLDLLLEMVRSDAYRDDACVSFLSVRYPHCTRILCAEELPDMSGLMFLTSLWFDTGVKKGKSSLLQSMTHLFMCKCMNQICQIRCLEDIASKYARTYVVVANSLALVLQCSLLGNFPRSANRTDLLGRLKLRAFFSAPEYSLDRLIPWIWLYRNTCLFAMREHFVAVVESYGLLDELLGVNHRWILYKEVVRNAMACARSHVSRSAAARPYDPVDWDKLESEPEYVSFVDERDGTRPYDRTPRTKGREKSRTAANESKFFGGLGTMKEYHGVQLKLCVKLHKFPFQKLLLKKMIAVEKMLDDVAVSFDAEISASKIDVPAFHLVCWYAARRKGNVFDTSWLKILGMSACGLKILNRIVYDYYINSASDDGHKKKVMTLYASNPHDFLILGIYLKLVERYKIRHVSFLSARQEVMQWKAVRAQMDLEPWTPSPPHSGIYHLCECCSKWAHAVVDKPSPAAVAAKMNAGNRSTSKKRTRPLEDIMDRLTSLFDGVHMLEEEEEEGEEEEGEGEGEGEGEEEEEEEEDRNAKDEAPAVDLRKIEDLMKPFKLKENVHLGSMPAGYWDPTVCELFCVSNKMKSAEQFLHAPAMPETKIATERLVASAMKKIISDVVADSKTCSDKPLLKVHMCGIFLSTKSDKFAFGLCILCGSLTTVKNRKFCTYGLLCGCHERKALGKSKGKVRCKFVAQCLHCKRTMTVKTVSALGPLFRVETVQLCTDDYTICKQLFSSGKIPQLETVVALLDQKNKTYKETRKPVRTFTGWDLLCALRSQDRAFRRLTNSEKKK